MKKKKQDSKLINAILIIFVMFVFIIIAEVIIVNKYLNRDKSYQKSLFSTKTNDLYYNTDDLTDVKRLPNPNKVYINDICTGDCNMYINGYYLILRSNNEKLEFKIVKDNKLLFTKVLGNKLENPYVDMYNGYITFYTIVNTDSFVYDYVVMVNDKKYIDEFTSLESNEIEFTDDGIIYYTYSCNKNNDEYNSYKVKKIRKPFSKNSKDLDKTAKNYSWCIN